VNGSSLKDRFKDLEIEVNADLRGFDLLILFPRTMKIKVINVQKSNFYHKAVLVVFPKQTNK